MKITSNTSVTKNGMPFLEIVLKQALPFVDQMIITTSKTAELKTLDVISRISANPKVEVYWEEIKGLGELTGVWNRQLEASIGDIIISLGDDDIWPSKDLENSLRYFDKNKNIDGVSINPFQLTDFEHYDSTKDNKFYTTIFRRDGAYWKLPFPKLLIYNKTGMLYWKKSDRVPKVPYHFYHLPLLKDWSFRNERQWEHYDYGRVKPVELPDWYKKELKKILDENSFK